MATPEDYVFCLPQVWMPKIRESLGETVSIELPLEIVQDLRFDEHRFDSLWRCTTLSEVSASWVRDVGQKLRQKPRENGSWLVLIGWLRLPALGRHFDGSGDRLFLEMRSEEALCDFISCPFLHELDVVHTLEGRVLPWGAVIREEEEDGEDTEAEVGSDDSPEESAGEEGVGGDSAGGKAMLRKLAEMDSSKLENLASCGRLELRVPPAWLGMELRMIFVKSRSGYLWDEWPMWRVTMSGSRASGCVRLNSTHTVATREAVKKYAREVAARARQQHAGGTCSDTPLSECVIEVVCDPVNPDDFWTTGIYPGGFEPSTKCVVGSLPPGR